METRIRHRKGRNFEALCPDGRWRSTGTNNMHEARIIAVIMNQKVPDDLFRDFADSLMNNRNPGSWYDINRNLNKISESSFETICNNLRIYVLPFFGKMRLCEITAPIIQGWYMDIRKRNGERVAPNTASRALEALSKVMAYGVFLGKLDVNPCEFVMHMRKTQQGYPRFTDAELEVMFPDSIPRLAEIYGDLTDALYFLIARDTGMRPGEIAGLSRDCYYPDLHGLYTMQSCDRRTRRVKESVKTTGRGNDDRYGFISPLTEIILQSVLSDGRDLIFSWSNGTLRGQEYYYRLLNRVLKKLGIPKNGRAVYSFRSTFFTRFLNEHSNAAAMAMMGHRNWHACYDQRTPDDIMRKARRIYDSSDIENAYKGYPDIVINERRCWY